MRINLEFRAALMVLLLTGPLTVTDVLAQNEDSSSHPLSGIPLRSIGPALTSGRVADFAFDAKNPALHYVGMASGNVWKTVNDGVTWSPVFDNEGAYAIGVVEMDPRQPNTVWVGTGENNSQRSVGYGDGIYLSLDGGKSWKNKGLKNSGHISMIHVHPQDSNTVLVAAQGPLWSPGGDRGLYRTSDQGDSWQKILDIDEHTGVNEFIVHPDNPDQIIASSYQRRRHVWTLINGGPGSGLHKTYDGGETWQKITRGLPAGDKGRIGLAMAPSDSNIVYAIVEAEADEQGVYRSTDFGESWEKRSGHMTSSPQYYNELVVDPRDPDVLYALDTITHKSIDGGAGWEPVSIRNRHVDDHALWIDPDNSDHFKIGGDGGIYETWDGGQEWRHVTNLPTVQFYRATPDNDAPFYNVCAGTQDNFTLCGPSRTTFTDGITNADWWIAQFGDGFKAQIDPTDPDIVYAQYQHGGLVRFDRVSGERLAITPHPDAVENNYRWNWNAPLVISPHDHRRLYFGAEKLFRSDDRGESWRAVSGDLSRQLDRNKLEVMGRIWGPDAIAKNTSTSMYGSLVSLDESPLREGLIYTGSDDGLIHVTQDGGENWRRVDSFRQVPNMSLVEDIIASRHDENVAYAVFDNHKRGDYKPYILRSSDKGKSWDLVVSGLPGRGSVHTLAEDHVAPGLLFAGTEFGLYFSTNRGDRWHELTAIPTIAVRDLEIQRRENDLVVGTFGRGVYILDDYSPLRTPVAELDAGAQLFPVRDSWLFNPDARRGWGGKGDFGTGRYSAENPPHGAVIRYHLAEGIQSLREQRREAEKKRAGEGEDNAYPDWDRLRREDREEEPVVVLTVTDAGGNVVRRLSGPTAKGFHQVAWDMRYPAPDPVDLSPPAPMAPWESEPRGPLALPGTYSVSLSRRVEGRFEPLAAPVRFELKPLHTGGLMAEDRTEVLAFQAETADVYRAIMGADRAAGEIEDRLEHLLAATVLTPGASEAQEQRLRALVGRMHDLRVLLNGDRTIAARQEPVPMALTQRISSIAGGSWESQSGVTVNFRNSLAVAKQQLPAVLAELRAVSADLVQLESGLEGIGAPWTPARIPEWPRN